MIPSVPFKIRTGHTLSPTRLTTNFERLAGFVEQSLALKYTESDIVLDFSGWTETSTDTQRSFLLKLPLAYEIVGTEVVIYAATGVSASVECRLTGTGNAPTGWEDTDDLASAGATTRARQVAKRRATVAASTEMRVTLETTAAGAYTLTRCLVILKIRHSRAPASTYGPADAPRFIGPTNVGDVNAAFTALETAVAADTAATNNLRVMVTRFKGEGAIATSDRDMRIPATARKLHSYDVVHTAPIGVNFTVTFLDKAGATVSTTTVNGATTEAKTQSVSVNQTQADDDSDDTADDWKQRSANAGGTQTISYVISYWV